MYESETEVAIPWVYNDGGRSTAGYRGRASDCVPRAIAIATRQDYRQVYLELQRRQTDLVAHTRSKRIKKGGAQMSRGVWPEVYKPYLRDLGWAWTPIMKVGSGVTMHLTYEEIPDVPTMIMRLSAHLTTVMHGVVHDVGDPSRDGTRAVYGYWTPGA